MRGLSKIAITEVELHATTILRSAVRKYGRYIPVCDFDYCEAFGVLRGAIATLGPRLTRQIRVAPGHGDATHNSVHDWLSELVERIIKENENSAQHADGGEK